MSIILLFLHLYCAILSYTHTWDDLHKSDSFENIPGMLSRQCQCMQWAGDCPVVTHCIRFKMMETPGPRGPGARSRYFGKDGEIRDIIKWRNAIAEISTPDSLTHLRKKIICRFFFWVISLHFKPLLDIKFFLKTSDLARGSQKVSKFTSYKC